MHEAININSGTVNYNVYIEGSFSGLCSAFHHKGLAGRDAFVVTDRNVSELGIFESFLNVCSETLNIKGQHIINPGEDGKTLETVTEIYKALSNAAADRKTVVIALGGGVVGDICGFAAATFMRGLPFVQIPTTLMAMVDSSIGGKTGVNFGGVKNLVGSFYPPELVYINTEALKSLPTEQFSSGLAEVIKYGLIRDKDFYGFLHDKADEILKVDENVINRLIHRSARIKAEIVGIDEKEAGLREILNFGHTFGHSIESLLNYSQPHGFCVGIGMTAALKLSAIKGYIDDEIVNKHISLCRAFNIPAKLSDISHNNEKPPPLQAADIYNNMLHDKKVRGGNIRLVLLNRVGEAVVCGGCSEGEILEGVGVIALQRQPHKHPPS